MVKIVRKWPLQDFVKFHMTTGEKLKAGWHGLTQVAPWIAYATVGVTAVFVFAACLKNVSTTVNRRKYCKQITVYRPGDPKYERISTYSSLD